MTSAIEERLEQVDQRLYEVEERLATQTHKPTDKRGWRWFVGIDANNPDFEEAVQLGRAWRFADSPVETLIEKVEAAD